MKTDVIIIDDENFLVESIQHFLLDYGGFTTRCAYNGKEGLSLLQEKTPDIILVDLKMPVMGGYEFIEKTKELHPDLPIIVLSGVGLVDDAIKAMQAGAWDFIPKPIPQLQVIVHTIERCLEKVKLKRENIIYQNTLEEIVESRTKQVISTKMRILQCLGKAAEFKDNETGNHVVRVGQMSMILAQGLGLPDNFCQVISDAAPMHDIGKIGIMDSVLLKNGKLDDKEWDHMKQHVKIGYDILSTGDYDSYHKKNFPQSLLEDDGGTEILTVAKRIALFHHERWDGKGYLLGLLKDEIPIEARIVSLVDVYDAVSSKRPYKEPFPEEKCRQIIKEGSGSQFDPDVVDVFFNNLDQIAHIKNSLCDK